MKYLVLAAILAVGFASFGSSSELKPSSPPPNPAIDIDGYLKVAQDASTHRGSRRLSEDDFIKASKEPGAIILDARSAEKFALLHIKGAINLSFSDIDVESLKRTLPDKDARILIYCNNNFDDVPGPAILQGQGQGGLAKVAKQPQPRPFASKLPTASLNISTYIALYNYGYRNIYELAPRLDPTRTKLQLVPSSK